MAQTISAIVGCAAMSVVSVFIMPANASGPAHGSHPNNASAGRSPVVHPAPAAVKQVQSTGHGSPSPNGQAVRYPAPLGQHRGSFDFSKVAGSPTPPIPGHNGTFYLQKLQAWESYHGK
jgi:hypothetical protein